MRKAFLVSLCCGLLTSLGLPPQASAAGTVGVVLLHGKLGAPMGVVRGRMATPIGADLIEEIERAGYLVSTPEMCWSRERGFDRAYADCFADIDASIADLKRHGATAIVVGGLSLGGNGAIAYAATHPGLLGVIGLSPADDPVIKAKEYPKVADDLVRARDLVAQGKGGVKTDFDDYNTGPRGVYSITLDTTPRIFLSFFEPDSLAHMPTNVAKLTMPLLWVAGDNDPSQRSGRAYAFDKAPPNPLNRYVTVHATHLEVPDAAAPAVLAWLSDLRRQRGIQ